MYRVDGILLIDKPAGITSHDVVAWVRRILRTKRVGHTGTLDPFATGVMAVLVGRATRLAQFLEKDEKEYIATAAFGFETDTGDADGKPTRECRLPVPAGAVEAVLPRFIGEIEQLPPMYSAKKIGGTKLYELARKGIEVQRETIKIRIDALEIVRPLTDADPAAVQFRVVCSAGTYVRTLAEDIARAAGTLAHLVELRRLRSGRFGIEQSIALERLAEAGDPSALLLPMKRAVEHLPVYALDAERSKRTLSGLSTRVFGHTFADNETAAMISDTGELIAVGRYDAEKNALCPKVVLV